MTDRKGTKSEAGGSQGTWRGERGSHTDVRLRRSGDRFRDEELSEREQRRAVSYGRARGRL